MLDRRSFVAGGLAGLAVGSPAWAQSYPTRTIQLVVPVDAGGAADTTARLLAKQLGQKTKVSVIVVNKPSVSGILGAKFVAESPADGYTLLFAPSTLTSAPYLMTDIGIDLGKDITPISEVAITPFVVIVNSKLPVKSIQDLIAYSRDNPETFKWGVGGIGTPGHLAIVSFETKASLPHRAMIPYKGEASALTAVMAGEAGAMLLSTAAAKALAADGPVRMLGVTTSDPLKSFPGLPTVAGSGFPGFQAATWFGVWGPKNMAPDLVSNIAGLIKSAFTGSDVNEFMDRIGGLANLSSSPAEFATFVASQFKDNGEIVKSLSIQPKT